MRCKFRTFRRFKARVPEPTDLCVGFPSAHRFDKNLMRGSQGYVEQWTHVRSRTVIVVKVIAHSPLHMPPEIEVLQDLPPHPSIIKYLGHHQGLPSPDHISLLFEFCRFGDLFSLRSMKLETDDYTWSEPFMWSVYTQMMAGLAFLHEGLDTAHPRGRENWRTISHRDIKFENCFIVSLGDKDDWSSLVIRVGDFGMAGYHDPSNPNPRGFIGTTYYWPPEVSWDTKHLTPASDVWGAAAIVHELAHSFGPVVSPELIEENYINTYGGITYPEHWEETHKANYWGAKAPRRIIPINLDPRARMPIMAVLSDPDLGGRDDRAIRFRENKPSPKYSEELNDCMMAGLEMSPEDRWTSGRLLQLIEGKHSDYVFHQRCIWQERERTLALLEGREKRLEVDFENMDW